MKRAILFFNCLLDQSQPQEAAATRAKIGEQKQDNEPMTTRSQQSSVNQIKKRSSYFPLNVD